MSALPKQETAYHHHTPPPGPPPPDLSRDLEALQGRYSELEAENKALDDKLSIAQQALSDYQLEALAREGALDPDSAYFGTPA